MAWINDVAVAAQTASHLVLTGNTRDLVIDRGPDQVRAVSVLRRLREWAAGESLVYLVVADPTLGLSRMTLRGDGTALPAPVAALPEHDESPRPAGELAVSPQQLAATFAWLGMDDVPGGMVVVDASRFVVDVRALSEAEHALFTVAGAHARRARLLAAGHRALYPPVYWLCQSERDLPAWFVADPRVRRAEVAVPTLAERQAFSAELLRHPPSPDGAMDEAEADEVARRLAAASHGMAAQALIPAVKLVREGHLPEQAADLVRLGVVEDRWTSDELRARLPEGQAMLEKKVRGQPVAVRHTWSVVRRSLVGLSGAHRPSSARLPKAVLLLVGPTGTGKTELAKTLAEVLFGDADALQQFDMAGYAHEHSDQRLIGSPPGYVGHAAGGELTNRLLKNPFSVFLFDEIEKAHPSMWDIFLSILQDGQIDDALGRRLYFDQSVIIFTSNLGIYREERESGQVVGRVPLVDPTTPYPEIQDRVTEAVRQHFISTLGRPELLNRFGDNIVVFDFLRPEAAREVFHIQMDNVARSVRVRHRRTLAVADEPLSALREACCRDLDFGGRGIANKVESLFLNPLAEAVFPRLGDLPQPLSVTRWRENPYPSVEVL